MKNLPKIKNITYKELKTDLSAEQLYSKYSHVPYSALLCGRGKKDNSRYTFIGINPFYLHVSAKNPFDEFQKLIDFYDVSGYKYPANLWGGIGYMSYDAAHFTEKLPKTTKNDINMPVMQMVFYKDLIIYDFHKNKKYWLTVELENEEDVNIKPPPQVKESPQVKKSSPKSFAIKGNLTFNDLPTYEAKVNKIIDYIKKGDVYEVNLSHRFSTAYSGDPYEMFLKLYKINDAPFSAYLPFGDHTIISNSPERFLYAQKDHIETRPIKGTAPRGKTKNADLANKNALKKSQKDDAELSMIVDLLRNDLGKVSNYGSVKVKEHKRIEAFKNVWHLISIIKGKLRINENYGSLLKACFPGGSITGCPKIRSMEIIDELEDFTRNLYTGTIFIANNVRLDSNIVIRTIIAHRNKFHFNVGGAVVYDSDPKKEYQETLDKAESILKALGAKI
jgi:para-aminobenzoate synthetase component 1